MKPCKEIGKVNWWAVAWDPPPSDKKKNRKDKKKKHKKGRK